jgi:hypothetical protein
MAEMTGGPAAAEHAVALVRPAALLQSRFSYEHRRSSFNEIIARYERELTVERLALAEYVVDRFIRPAARLFVHASSSTLALAMRLNAREELRPTVLTNSVVLQFLLDGERVSQIFSPGFPIPDDECGGTLPHAYDPKLRDKLVTMVAQAGDQKLDSAVIYPYELSVDDGPCFKMVETARLIAYLAEFVDTIYVLCQANRVVLRGSGWYSVRSVVDAEKLGWQSIKKKMRLVIPGFDGSEGLRDRFKAANYDVELVEKKWIQPGFKRTVESVKAIMAADQQQVVQGSVPSSVASNFMTNNVFSGRFSSSDVARLVAQWPGNRQRKGSLGSTIDTCADREQITQMLWEGIGKSLPIFLDQIVEPAFRLIGAREIPEGCTKQDLKEFRRKVTEIFAYSEAIRTNEYLSGGGEGGAAKQADVTRQTLNKALNELGLKSEDFSNYSIPELIRNSKLEPVASAVLYFECCNRINARQGQVGPELVPSSSSPPAAKKTRVKRKARPAGKTRRRRDGASSPAGELAGAG